jgi:hypothetical protein
VLAAQLCADRGALLLASASFERAAGIGATLYAVGAAGADLGSWALAPGQWGNRWLSDTDGPAELLHRGCGVDFHPSRKGAAERLRLLCMERSSPLRGDSARLLRGVENEGPHRGRD